MKTNKKIRNLCILTYEYPSDKKIIYTFLEQLVNEFTDNGINCYVISPQSISKNVFRKFNVNKKHYIRRTYKNNIVNVYSPYYLTYGKRFININLKNYIKQADRIFKKLSKNIKFDAIYAQFIFPSAICANVLKSKYNIPVFLAYGEHSGYTIDYFGKEKTKELLSKTDGVISVSNDNKKRLIDNDILSKDIIEVFPNGINNKIFYKKDKTTLRKKFGVNKDDFVVAFVGNFIYRKGIDRLCKALNLINNDHIKAIFIGNGDLKPNYKNTIFKGELTSNEIADFLSMSDIFVLPTNSEGCCNAIIEAMACSLPIISSKDSFNDDILDDSCSIRIDSMNVNEIKDAIELLYKDEKLRNNLSKGALEKSKNFNLEKRAKNIINFMENILYED